MTTVLTTYKHIVQTPEIVGGKPRIAGHRITVQNVVIWHEQMGYSIEEIASHISDPCRSAFGSLHTTFDHKTKLIAL